MLSNGGITEQDYIISCNIQSFVRRAVNEDRQFYTKTYEQKMETMRKYAEEVQTTNEPKQQAQPIDFGGLDNLPTDEQNGKDNTHGENDNQDNEQTEQNKTTA